MYFIAIISGHDAFFLWFLSSAELGGICRGKCKYDPDCKDRVGVASLGLVTLSARETSRHIMYL
jgi:hypothetical protein